MNITLITSDQIRHNYLVNLLSNIATKLNVIQEKKTFFCVRNQEKHRILHESGREKSKSRSDEWDLHSFSKEIQLDRSREPEPC